MKSLPLLLGLGGQFLHLLAESLGLSGLLFRRLKSLLPLLRLGGQFLHLLAESLGLSGLLFRRLKGLLVLLGKFHYLAQALLEAGVFLGQLGLPLRVAHGLALGGLPQSGVFVFQSLGAGVGTFQPLNRLFQHGVFRL